MDEHYSISALDLLFIYLFIYLFILLVITIASTICYLFQRHELSATNN